MAASPHPRAPSDELTRSLFASASASAPPADNSPTSQPSRGLDALLRKSSRHEVPVVTAEDGHTMLRKWKLREEQLRREREEREAQPPPLPPLLPALNGPQVFHHSLPDHRPDSLAIISNKASNFSRPYHPAPMSPSTSMPALNKHQSPQALSPSLNYLTLDPKSPNESLDGRHYSLSSNVSGYPSSSRRARRRRDPTPFNVLVVGAKGAGKTTLIDFLKSSLELPPEKRLTNPATPRLVTSTEGTFPTHFVECDFERERIGLTIYDSPGLEKNLVDLQVRDLVNLIETRFEDTFMEESKVMRSPNSKDSLIHCVFLVLDPSNLDRSVRASKAHANGNAFAQAKGPSGLDDDLDLQVMKSLAGKTTVIPIISKADTLTGAHMEYLKRSVWNSVQSEKLDPLEALDLEDESDSDFDDDDTGSEEHSPLPIQSTDGHAMSEPILRFHDDSDISDSAITDMSPIKTRSTVTTPSPGHAMKRNSRLPMRSGTPGEAAPEDVYIPFSLLTPDPYEFNAVGRRFAWGMADPYNAEHCDYVRLKDSVFVEWRDELRSAARDKWYEAWRSSRLAGTPQQTRRTGGVTPASVVPTAGRSFSGGSKGGLSPMPYQTGLGPSSPTSAQRQAVAQRGSAF